ncbi:hypothetical protein CEP50_09535 [Actinopolyspora mortivallis]|uniref:RNA polymerase sigma-70 region 2 domain-containing protein n=1 Tax=Actinopolyspora mortivallis TaxID=33906 RepID=A0A2T0GWR5_ACTMO|nr:hypothetical protein CEP50_09535 [Actinopolyspora mortivallis]
MSEPAVADTTHGPERPLSDARRRSTAFKAGLIEACRAGQPWAWSKLITEYQPLVWTVARSFGLNHADSEDLCQLTWQRLHEHMHQLQTAQGVRLDRHHEPPGGHETRVQALVADPGGQRADHGPLHRRRATRRSAELWGYHEAHRTHPGPDPAQDQAVHRLTGPAARN